VRSAIGEQQLETLVAPFWSQVDQVVLAAMSGASLQMGLLLPLSGNIREHFGRRAVSSSGARVSRCWPSIDQLGPRTAEVCEALHPNDAPRAG